MSVFIGSGLRRQRLRSVTSCPLCDITDSAYRSGYLKATLEHIVDAPSRAALIAQETLALIAVADAEQSRRKAFAH